MNKDDIMGTGKKPVLIGGDDKASKLASVLMMGAAMGMDISPMIGGPSTERPQRPDAERDPRFNRVEKILPTEYFISVGPGEKEDDYYACVMAPNQAVDPDNNEDGALEPYIIIAKCRYGFATEDEAKLDAARQFPSLPVLFEGQTYSYPYYNDRIVSVLQEAQDRRDRKAEKLIQNSRRTAEGKDPTIQNWCGMCNVPIRIGDAIGTTDKVDTVCGPCYDKTYSEFLANQEGTSNE